MMKSAEIHTNPTRVNIPASSQNFKSRWGFQNTMNITDIERMDDQRSADTTDILIVGAGIGGLTLAAICHKLNIPYLVLERGEKITPQGAGISLSANALRVLDQLGIFDDIAKEGQDLRKMLIYYGTTKWRELDFTCYREKFGYAVYAIERHRFHRLLHEAAGGDDFVRLNAQVDDLIDDETKPYVTVTTTRGQEFRGKVVVGADGIRSATRRLLGRNSGDPSATNTIRFTGRVHMSGYTRPISHLTERETGVGTWMLYDRTILTTWPCKDNRQWYIGVKVSSTPTVDRKPNRAKSDFFLGVGSKPT